MKPRTQKSIELYNTLLNRGFPQEFCEQISLNLNTDWTAQRMLGCLLFGQPKYYGRPGWERVPTASNRKEVKLGELEKQILEMLRIGHCYMSDLTDALGVDSMIWFRIVCCRH